MKVVIVTGAGHGIGRATAFEFASAGYAVVIADKDDIAGEDTAMSAATAGVDTLFVHADISKPPEIKSMIRKVEDKFGGVDILVNNAGFGIWKQPVDLALEEWDLVIDTNLRGTFLCSREVVPLMQDRGGGSIINIASTRALMSEPGSEAYAASKGGIVSLTHAMAASLSKYRIRVNCISPGWIETGDYDKLRDVDHNQHFSGRVGRPSDVAKTCLFIAGNEFINGENIIIDGGMTRKMIYEP